MMECGICEAECQVCEVDVDEGQLVCLICASEMIQIEMLVIEEERRH